MCGWLTSQDGDHLLSTADLNFPENPWFACNIYKLHLYPMFSILTVVQATLFLTQVTRFQCVQKNPEFLVVHILDCIHNVHLLRLFSHCDWFTIYCGEENACQRDGISLTCRLRAHPSPLVHYLPAFHSFFLPISLDINQHFYVIDSLFVWFSLSLPPTPAFLLSKQTLFAQAIIQTTAGSSSSFCGWLHFTSWERVMSSRM